MHQLWGKGRTGAQVPKGLQRITRKHLRVNNKKYTVVSRSKSQASKDIREKQILKQKQVPQCV